MRYINCQVALSKRPAITHRGNPCECKAARGLLCVMTDSARESKHGVLCHVSGTTAQGEHVVASWKCWSRAVGDNRLRWELRRIAPSCGFSDKSKHTIVSRQISWNWSRWEGVLCSSGLQPAEHMGQSRRALQRLREADDDDEQEHWCSSEGVLTLLLYWSAHRKAVCHRMLAE